MTPSLASLAALQVLGWALVVQGVAVRRRLPGLLVHDALCRAPAAALMVLGAACVALPLGLARGALAVAGVALALPCGAVLALGLSGLRRLRPDDRYLDPSSHGCAWSTTPLASPALADSGAVRIAPRGGGSGRCVLLLHGGGNDRIYGFWHLIPALVARGLEVVIANLPGHGRGGADLFSLEAARARVDGLVAAIRGGPGAAEVIVLGQSLGGALALDLAARAALASRGQRIDRVVAVSAPARIEVGGAVALELCAFARPAVYNVLRYGTVTEVLPAAGAFLRDRFPVRLPPGERYVPAFARAIASLDLVASLGALRGERPPVLLVHGTRDGVVPFSQAEALAGALGGGASLVAVRGATHLDPLLDDGCIEAILGWIDASSRREDRYP